MNRRRAAQVKALDFALANVPDSAIDQLVGACAAEQENEVNSSGRHAQLDYLLRNGWTADDIVGRAKIAAAGG